MALYISHKCLHCLQTARTWQKRHILGWKVSEAASGTAVQGSSGELLAISPDRRGRGSQASQQSPRYHPPHGLICVFHPNLALLGHPGECSGQENVDETSDDFSWACRPQS